MVGTLGPMSDFAANPEAGDEDTGPVTIYDIQAAEESKVRVRALPRLSRQALRLALAAGSRDFMISTLLQVVGGGGIVLLRLSGNRACRHFSTRCNKVGRSPLLPRGRLGLPPSPVFSHSSRQSNANVSKCWAN